MTFISFLFKPFFFIPLILKKGNIPLKYLFLALIPLFFILKDYQINSPPKRVFEIIEQLKSEKVEFFVHPSIYYQIKKLAVRSNIITKPKENLKELIALFKNYPHHPPLEGYKTFDSDIILTLSQYPKNPTLRNIKKEYALAYCGKEYAMFIKRDLAAKSKIKTFENYSPYVVTLNDNEKRKLALIEIDEILKYEPQFFEALRDKGRILIDLKEYEKAIEVLKDALKIRKSGEVYNDIGVAYYNLQKYDLALENFLYSVKLMPNALYPRMGLALCAYELDRLEEAKIILEDLNSKFPTFYPAFRLHSRVYAKLRDIEKAKELLRKIPKEYRTIDENELLNEK